MAVSGLADGFLAGFNTVNNYQRGQKADERADKELGLRDAMWQNEQDRQRVADERYQGEIDYRAGRDKEESELRKLERADRQRQLDIDNKRANAQLGLSLDANNRARESHALSMEKNARDQWELEHGPAANAAILAVVRGESISAQQNELLNHKYMASKDPRKILGDTNWHEASGRVFGNIKTLLSNPEAGAWDMQKLYGEINTEQNRKDFTYLFKGDLDKGIGTMTPNGTVKAFDNLSIVPTGRGTFTFDATVTYADPKTGKDVVMEHVPITEGRSGDPKALVMESTPEQLIKRFGQGYQFSQLAQQHPQQIDDFLSQVGLKSSVDYKGLQNALAGLQKQKAKALAGGGDPATVTAAFAEAEKNLPSIYGVNTGGAPGAESDTPPKLPEQVSGWVSGDKRKQNFIDAAVSSGFDFSAYTPEQLDKKYQSAIKTQRQQAAYEAIMGGVKQ